VSACTAVDAKESVGEDAALEIAADLALDEAGDGRPRRPRSGEEGLEFIPHDFVKERLFGLVTCVAVDGEESIGTASNRSGALTIY